MVISTSSATGPPVMTVSLVCPGAPGVWPQSQVAVLQTAPLTHVQVAPVVVAEAVGPYPVAALSPLLALTS